MESSASAFGQDCSLTPVQAVAYTGAVIYIRRATDRGWMRAGMNRKLSENIFSSQAFLGRRYFAFCLSAFLFFSSAGLLVNSSYSHGSPVNGARAQLLRAVHLASPVITPAGRNIAFETGNSMANGPGTYLNHLDCCESDEAIADRIAIGKTFCRVVRRDGH